MVNLLLLLHQQRIFVVRYDNIFNMPVYVLVISLVRSKSECKGVEKLVDFQFGTGGVTSSVISQQGVLQRTQRLPGPCHSISALLTSLNFFSYQLIILSLGQ